MVTVHRKRQLFRINQRKENPMCYNPMIPKLKKITDNFGKEQWIEDYNLSQQCQAAFEKGLSGDLLLGMANDLQVQAYREGRKRWKDQRNRQNQ